MLTFIIISMIERPRNKTHRLIFKEGKQKEFINEVKRKSGLTWKELSMMTGLCVITLRHGFRKEIHSMSYNIFQKLCKLGKVNPSIYLSDIKDVRDKGWGRAKGGRIGGSKSKTGTPKIHINIPQPSTKLAEFIGILLGDGSLCKTNYAMEIVLNKRDDEPYSDYVFSLIRELFGVKPKKILPRDRNVLHLRVNSRSLFEFLLSLGMSPGRAKKTIPDFIYNEKQFLSSALRGLFDTDGSVHLSSRWCTLNFKSRSPALKEQIILGLGGFGIPAFISGHNINLTSKWKIERFMQEIGSSNIKNVIKFIEYTQNKRTVRSGDVKHLFPEYKSIALPYHGTMV